MTAIDLPVSPLRHHRRALTALLIMAFLGMLAMAAVREARLDCRTQYLLLNTGGYLLKNNGERFPLDKGRQRCQVDLGGIIRVPLPEWAKTFIGR